MTKTMTWTDAKGVARTIVRRIGSVGHQWDLGAIDACLPAEWCLHPAATADDFYPVTVSHVADAIRRRAVRAHAN